MTGIFFYVVIPSQPYQTRSAVEQLKEIDVRETEYTSVVFRSFSSRSCSKVQVRC